MLPSDFVLAYINKNMPNRSFTNYLYSKSSWNGIVNKLKENVSMGVIPNMYSGSFNEISDVNVNYYCTGTDMLNFLNIPLIIAKPAYSG